MPKESDQSEVEVETRSLEHLDKMVAISHGDLRLLPGKQEFLMSFITLQTMSWFVPRLLSKTALSLLMQIPSDFGILKSMMLNLIKRKLKRVTKLELKPKDLDTSLLKSRPMLRIRNWTANLPNSSTQVDSLPAFLPAQDSVAVAMVTSLKEKNSSSTKRKWRRRRERVPSEQLLDHLTLFNINPHRICSFSSDYQISVCAM